MQKIAATTATKSRLMKAAHRQERRQVAEYKNAKNNLGAPSGKTQYHLDKCRQFLGYLPPDADTLRKIAKALED